MFKRSVIVLAGFGSIQALSCLFNKAGLKENYNCGDTGPETHTHPSASLRAPWPLFDDANTGAINVLTAAMRRVGCKNMSDLFQSGQSRDGNCCFHSGSKEREDE